MIMIIMCTSTNETLAQMKLAIFVNVSRVDDLIFQCEEEKKEGYETKRQREDHRWYLRVIHWSTQYRFSAGASTAYIYISMMRFSMMNSETITYLATDRAISNIFTRLCFSRFLKFSRPCLFFLPSAHRCVCRCYSKICDREWSSREMHKNFNDESINLAYSDRIVSLSTNDSFAAILDCVSIYLKNYFYIRNRYQSSFFSFLSEEYAKYCLVKSEKQTEFVSTIFSFSRLIIKTGAYVTR